MLIIVVRNGETMEDTLARVSSHMIGEIEEHLGKYAAFYDYLERNGYEV